MCGRFTLTVDPADLQAAFPDFSFPPQGAPRFNIAPTQPVLAVAFKAYLLSPEAQATLARLGYGAP